MNTRKNQYLRGVNLDIIDNLPYKIPSVSGGENGGCDLYIGNSGNITVKNISGDIVTFTNPLQGTILPFSVVEVLSMTDELNLVALW